MWIAKSSLHFLSLQCLDKVSACKLLLYATKKEIHNFTIFSKFFLAIWHYYCFTVSQSCWLRLTTSNSPTHCKAFFFTDTAGSLQRSDSIAKFSQHTGITSCFRRPTRAWTAEHRYMHVLVYKKHTGKKKATKGWKHIYWWLISHCTHNYDWLWNMKLSGKAQLQIPAVQISSR